MKKTIGLVIGAASVAACQTSEISSQARVISKAEASSSTKWPDTLRVFGNGYPKTGDPCREIGESMAVINYLDHTERLLGCPSLADAKKLGGTIVGTEKWITLVSVVSLGP